MNNRISRIKIWSALVSLVAVMLLGGCLRFGPQEDEMANTNVETTDLTEQSTEGAKSESEEKSTEETFLQEGNAKDSIEETSTVTMDGTDSQSNDGSAEEESSADEETDKENKEDQVEVTITRDDAERILVFNLQQLPKGYSLSSMSWQPEAAQTEEEGTQAEGTEEAAAPNDSASSGDSNGGSVSGQDDVIEVPTVENERITSTYYEAVTAGETGMEGFFVDHNGQRIGYRYAENQADQSGIVRIDFRNGEGGIVTWEDRITIGLTERTEELDERIEE
ncbi:hypothetical protein [Saccharibacillus kuerlensis]|uniref:Uncharacterized protein n=1 Tax=Saccharibacillus kuerlensis TaxID=459527 RepID=A0ABQ2L7P0_9BACL|nr:hypothetical protein [Saccharibacillus kuerlensis]GGO06200.1 hypothetical protein GCM10010969_33350 [Saccharibacillus kuerlensis]